MGTPQIIAIVLMVITMMASGILHGQEKGKWNFFLEAISVAAWVSILYSGGFFK